MYRCLIRARDVSAARRFVSSNAAYSDCEAGSGRRGGDEVVGAGFHRRKHVLAGPVLADDDAGDVGEARIPRIISQIGESSWSLADQ
jgi:hypothetical protein